MKYAILLFLLSTAAQAQIVTRELKEISVVMMDAECIPSENEKGYLELTLQLESSEPDVHDEGKYHSYNGDIRESNWHLLPLQKCLDLEKKLLGILGKKVRTSGTVYEKIVKGDYREEIQGRCSRGGGHDGPREFYTCPRGSRAVRRTGVHREIVFSLFNQKFVK